MTLDFVLSRLAEALDEANGPVDLSGFAASFFPYDAEAGRLLEEAFRKWRVRGRATFDSVFRVSGHVSALTAPVKH